MENLPFYCLSGLLLTRRLLKTVQVHVRSDTIQKLRLQNQMTDSYLVTTGWIFDTSLCDNSIKNKKMPVAPVAQLVTSQPSDTLGLEFESW